MRYNPEENIIFLSEHDVGERGTHSSKRHHSHKEKYKHGTKFGDLNKSDMTIVEKELKKLDIKSIRDIKYKYGFIGGMVISFLSYVDDGLIFIILIHLMICLFISVIWFFIASLDSVKDEINKNDFTGAFTPIVFLITFIVIGYFKRSISNATSRSKKFLDYLHSVKILANSIANGINKEDLEIKTMLRKYCMALAYHSSCFSFIQDVNLDIFYFVFRIYEGEMPVSITFDYTDIDIDAIIRGTEDAMIINENRALISPPEDLIKDIKSCTFWLTSLHNNADDKYSRETMKRRTDVTEILTEKYTMDELRFIEYRLRKNHSQLIENGNDMRDTQYRLSCKLITRISNLVSQLNIPDPTKKKIAENSDIVSGKLNSIWIEGTAVDQPIYDIIFEIITYFYLFFLVPLQVISNTNNYWSLVFNPTIMMIYKTPVVVADWIGPPFSQRKENLHPPHRLHRAIALKEIAEQFGLHIDRMDKIY